MSNTADIIGFLNLQANRQSEKHLLSVNDALKKLNTSMDGFIGKLSKAEDKSKKLTLAEKLGKAVVVIGKVSDGIQKVSKGLVSINQPKVALTEELNKLSTSAKVTGNKLSQLERLGRENAKTYGGDASKAVATYGAIVNELNPSIAQVPSALAAMGDSVSITSKLMGGDATAATNLLTTAMKTYDVSTDSPTKASYKMAEMMNVMAAASQAGSASLPRVQAALEGAGKVAKKAGLSFEETNAAIQVLDTNGKRGAEGGKALKGVLGALSNTKMLPASVKAELEAAGVDMNTLSDKSLSLAQRLQPLEGVMSNAGVMTKVFGMEHRNAAKALIGNVDGMTKMTGAVTDTKAANEEAAVIMDSSTEKSSRFASKVNDIKIMLSDATGGVMNYAGKIGMLATDISNVLPAFMGMGQAISFVTNAQKMQTLWTNIVTIATSAWSAAQSILNFVMSPIFLIPAAIIAIGAGLAWVITRTQGWGKAWKYALEGGKLAFKGFVEAVKTYYTGLFQGFMIGINKIQEGFFKFRKSVGIGNKEENQKALDDIRNDTEKRKKIISDGIEKSKDLFARSGEAFKKAAGSISLKPKEEKDNKPKGIQLPRLFGAKIKKVDEIEGGNNVGPKTNKAISTGGTKHNYTTINLRNLVENFTVKGDDFKENTEQVKEELLDQLLRLLGLAVTATS